MYTVTIFNNEQPTVIHTDNPDLAAPKILNATLETGVNLISHLTFDSLDMSLNLQEHITLVTVFSDQDNTNIFEGRILSIAEKMDSKGKLTRHVVCEGRLGYLCDTRVRKFKFENITTRDFLTFLINNHNAHCDEYKQFVLGTVEFNDSINRSSDIYETTLNIISDRLLKHLGGEITITKNESNQRILNYVKQSGTQNISPIRLGKNMKAMELFKDLNGTYTRIIPVGRDKDGNTVTIASANNGIDYLENSELIAKYGVIEKSIEFKDISNPSILLEKGNEALQEGSKISRALKLTALDLSMLGKNIQGITAGDDIQVINPLMSVDEYFRVVKKTFNLSSPWLSSIEIMNKYSSLTGRQSTIASITNKMDKIIPGENINTSYLQGTIDCIKNGIVASGEYQDAKVIDRQGILLENNAIGSAAYGAMYLYPGGFMVADKKIGGVWDWRTFGNGTGFTADLINSGIINADLIQTGHLKGDLIQAGTVKMEKLEASTRETIDSIGDKADFSYVETEISNANNEINLRVKTSEIGSQIQQNADSVKIAVGTIGGNNLLKNTVRFKDLTYWMLSKGPGQNGSMSIVNDKFKGDVIKLTKENDVFWFSLQQAFYEYKDTNLDVNKNYTLSFYVKADEVLTATSSVWDSIGGNDLVTPKQSSIETEWQRVIHTFTPSIDCDYPIPYISMGSVGTIYLTEIKMEEGENATAWSQNPNEIETSTVIVNDDGLEVTHTNVGTKTKMDANGFKILDTGTGDVIGEFISSNGSMKNFSNMYATNGIFNNVTAGNILTYQSTPVTFYVDGTSGDDTNDGTSSYKLKTLEEALRRINKVIIDGVSCYIYLYGTLNGDILIENYQGGGALSIIADRAVRINGTIKVNNCHLRWLEIIGSRTGYSDPGGARITGGSAISFSVYNSSFIVIKGWQVVQNGTSAIHYSSNSNGYVYCNDICGCTNGNACLIADYGSQVNVYDNLGSNNSYAYISKHNSRIGGGNVGGGMSVPSATTLTLANSGGNFVLLGNYPPYESKFNPPAYIPTQRTTTYYTTQTQSWRDSSWRTDNNYIYQGIYGYGNHKGFMCFNSASIRSTLAGVTNLSGKIYLHRRNSGGSSASTNIYLWGHTYDSTGGGYSLTQNYGCIGSWAWNEGKTVSLPNTVLTHLQNGTIHGLALYISTSSYSYYAIFDNAYITLTYTK